MAKDESDSFYNNNTSFKRLDDTNSRTQNDNDT